MESPDAALWELAIKKEMRSLIENEAFTVISLLEGKQAVCGGEGCWVYTTKEGQGDSKIYKAKFVVKATYNCQHEGVDVQKENGQKHL